MIPRSDLLASWRSMVTLCLVISVVVVAIVGGSARALDATSSDYSPPSLQKAQKWGDDFCSYWDQRGGGYVGDMIWISSRGGDGTDVYADSGDATANVRINAAGKYCSQYVYTPGMTSYGEYWDNLGIIPGTWTDQQGNKHGPTINYPPGSANNYFRTWDDTATINISGLPAGRHQICITLRTNYRNIASQPSPTACSDITLHLREKWTTDGQSLVGVDHSPNVVTWPADPPAPDPPALPNSVISWNHKLWDNSGYDMDRTIYWSVRQSGFTGGASWRNGSADPQGWNSGPANGSKDRPFIDQGPQWDATQYRVSQDDVGHTLCQWLVWTPQRYDVPIDTQPTGMSPKACVTVPYRFNLTPSIDSLGREFGDQGGTIPTVTARVKNDGPTKSYDGTNWRLSTIIVKPGGSVAGAADNRQDGCAYYGNTCSDLSGSGPTFMPPDSTQVAQLVNQQIGDLEVGSQLCYGLSVMAYNQGVTNASGWWRHSAPQCVVIGKRPKAQVWGGDLIVGRRFNDDVTAPSASRVDVSTSTKDNGTKTFGSWIEYGIFAPGEITGGSAAGLAGPTGNASSAQSDWSKLTFANGGQTADSGCIATGFGCYAKPGAMGVIPDVASRLAPGKVTDAPQLPNGALDSLSGTYYAAGDATITGGTIAKGKSVVIRAAGTVRITGDIHYTGDSMTSIDDIPQVVIIANNIIINDNVSNVDAWLIANGTSGGIYTCGDLKAILTSKVCDKQLTVNGPVMSKKLFLQRTAGSGTDTASGDPAEVLNLRADAYLWAISHSGGAGGIQTVDTHELAPRF